MKTISSPHGLLLLLLIAFYNLGCANRKMICSPQQLQKAVDGYLEGKKDILGAFLNHK